jgi:peroxiredoxin
LGFSFVPAILLTLALALSFVLVFQLMRQNGRIMLRLEVLERLATQGAAATSPSAAPMGLPLGSQAPAFELPTLEGGRISLDGFRGRRLLLTFFSPSCGYCQRMAPDLSRLKQEGSSQLFPILITNGSVEANQKLLADSGIDFPVALQNQMDVATSYRVSGTPMAYLVDAKGRIASPVAVGADQILRLATNGGLGSNGAHKGNKSLADSRILRSGLPPGTAAPDFHLSSVTGEEVSLGDYRGRPLLLVFSDPDCGPCNELAPKLDQEYRRVREIQVLMISRGSLDANKAKVREHGLTFPVALQRRWEVSQAYGMFATPIAFLIDKAGVIEAGAATGVEGALSLFAIACDASAKEGMPVK